MSHDVTWCHVMVAVAAHNDQRQVKWKCSKALALKTCEDLWQTLKSVGSVVFLPRHQTFLQIFQQLSSSGRGFERMWVGMSRQAGCRDKIWQDDASNKGRQRQRQDIGKGGIRRNRKHYWNSAESRVNMVNEWCLFQEIWGKVRQGWRMQTRMRRANRRCATPHEILATGTVLRAEDLIVQHLQGLATDWNEWKRKIAPTGG
jgi:hypothetical protein